MGGILAMGHRTNRSDDDFPRDEAKRRFEAALRGRESLALNTKKV
jgi:hypothetical protein